MVSLVEIFWICPAIIADHSISLDLEWVGNTPRNPVDGWGIHQHSFSFCNIIFMVIGMTETKTLGVRLKCLRRRKGQKAELASLKRVS